MKIKETNKIKLYIIKEDNDLFILANSLGMNRFFLNKYNVINIISFIC